MNYNEVLVLFDARYFGIYKNITEVHGKKWVLLLS
jgi:hypothetical protein